MGIIKEIVNYFYPTKLNYIPLEGTYAPLEDGFYRDMNGELWEVFEGVWVFSHEKR